MSGRRCSARERRPLAAQKKRKAEAELDGQIVVKSEAEDDGGVLVTSDDRDVGKSAIKCELESRWEWLDDGDTWMSYAPELSEQINQAMSSGKQSVTISPVAGVSLRVDFKKMVQKNTKSGYQRFIRFAVKEQDQFFVWQWHSDDGSWVSYDAKTSILLETSLHTDTKLVSLSLGGRPYTFDLGAMVQKNNRTQHEREIQRHLSDAKGNPPTQNASNGLTAAKRPRASRNTGSKETEIEESKEQVKTLLLKGKAPVDPECSTKLGKAHVYSEGDDVYDIMLNQGGTTRYLDQHSLGEEYYQQDHSQQHQLAFHSRHSMPHYIRHHGNHVTVSGLPTLLEKEPGDIRHYADRLSMSGGRAVHNTVRAVYPQRKSTVWDYFHLKDPSIGIRNATSAFCNLCNREVKRGSTPGRLGTTAMRNHLAKHHQTEWAATGTNSVVAAASTQSTSSHHFPVPTTSPKLIQGQGLPLLRSVLDICSCFFATICTLCGAVISRGVTVRAKREYLMLQHMQSAHCSILQASLNEMQGGGLADDDRSDSSS